MAKTALMDYLPDFYKNILETKWISEVETAEFTKLWKQIEEYLLNNFVLTADEDTISKYEKDLSIMPNKQKEDLDFRKRRIINFYSQKNLLTINWLHKQIAFINEGRAFTITRDEALKNITINLIVDNLNTLKNLNETIERILPLNMLFEIIYTALSSDNVTLYLGVYSAEFSITALYQ